MNSRQRKATVIAVASPRQGIGKSVVALNLAASLTLAEKRVLLVVADPRHTVALHTPKNTTLYEVLHDNIALSSAIAPAALPQLEVVPSSPALWRLEADLLCVKDRELRMQQTLLTVSTMYDFLLIDCPSALDLLALSALLAADKVIIPINATTSMCAEAEQLLRVIANLRRTLQPSLGGVHLVANKVNKQTNHHHQPPLQLLAVQIPTSTDIATAAVLGLPTVLQAADSDGATAFHQLAKTLLATDTTTAQEHNL